MAEDEIVEDLKVFIDVKTDVSAPRLLKAIKEIEDVEDARFGAKDV